MYLKIPRGKLRTEWRNIVAEIKKLDKTNYCCETVCFECRIAELWNKLRDIQYELRGKNV